jgi:pimeloyl-ACP methyl ester carboxylesterase
MPFAEVADHRVYYEERGSGDPVLLISGLAADHTAWAQQTAFLERRYRVIVFDNPGIGRTEGPRGPYSTRQLAGVAAGLLRHLGLDHAHVVGASLGGAVAQQLALERPELVRSLSLHGTWARSDRYLQALMRSWQAAARVLSRLDLCRQLWLFTFTVWWFNDRPEALEELERDVAADPGLQRPDQFCDQVEACLAHDVLDRLGEIEAPTYLSVGDRDILTPAHHAYAIKQRLSSARLRVWQKMGHAPFWEIPDEFNARQLEFLQAH